MSGQKDGVERELKIAVSDLNGLRERLAELDAERLAPSAFEDNWLLDRDGELAAAETVLRIRSDRHGARLTFKGPASFEGRAKVRDEAEVRVSDALVLREIFAALGFRVVRRYQKQREEWQLGGVVIALDHTPIGDYVEFEGRGAEKVARRCGFDPAGAERRTYTEIYEEHRRAKPDSPPDMIFP